VKNTLSSRHGELISVFSVVQYAVVVASFLILSAIATAAGFRRKMGRFQPLNRHKYRLSPIWFFAAIIIGVVTNAFICGAFSSLNDRFQARVMWLIPLSAFLALAQGQQSTANADRDGPSLIAPS
jgi:hypothetical protein